MVFEIFSYGYMGFSKPSLDRDNIIVPHTKFAEIDFFYLATASGAKTVLFSNQ